MADSSPPPAAPYLRGYVADPAHGPLLGLLLLLTVTTGMVDAVTILRLGTACCAPPPPPRPCWCWPRS
nr:hypothetical protein [uncultured Actinoplanes sp.]